MDTTTTPDIAERRQRLRALGLYGLAGEDDHVLAEPWVGQLIEVEERERQRRSLKRRLANARLGAFKPIADFDWTGPARSNGAASRNCSRSTSSPRPPTSCCSAPTGSARP